MGNTPRYSGYYDDRLTAASNSLVAYGIDLRSFAESGGVAVVTKDLDVTVYDASYIALALTVEGRAYTTDEHLVSATADTGYADRLAHVEGYG